MNSQRLETLDYLRGVAAFGIMVYHYLMWTIGPASAASLLGKWGIYGVAIFYVLSGLTLFHVYFNKMTPTAGELKSFYIKRIFRIFPLLWLVITIMVVASGFKLDWTSVFLSYTGLFSLIGWWRGIGTGVWSIGNELCFYLLFPLMVILAKRSRPAFWGLGLVLLAVSLYFAFYKLTPDSKLAEQWPLYTNPLSHAILFYAGFAIGLVTKHIEVDSRVAVGGLIAAVLAFWLYPVTAVDQIALVTGPNRLVFMLLCGIICFCLYKWKMPESHFLGKPLSHLGEISYSVYLLHPIVWLFLPRINKHLFKLPHLALVPVAMIITVLMAGLVYRYYEKYFVRLGGKLASKGKPKAESAAPQVVSEGERQMATESA